jgi:hypothetical protein
VLFGLRLELESDLKTVSLYDIKLWDFWKNGVFFDTKIKVSCMIKSL